MFSFGAASKSKLVGVHPELIRVAERAIQISSVDFGISEGVREYARQVELVAQKKSTTLHSKHLIQGTGFAHAIDVFAFINGKASFQWKYYGPIVQAFIEAGTALGVQLRFGHLWKDFTDSVHIELNGKYY
jgi:peptidoglycan L-alanyl-D-glutamate endopeptidase CwlK